MTRRHRVLLYGALAVLVGWGSIVATFAVFAVRSGMIAVDVRDAQGNDVRLRVPAILVDIALRVAPDDVFQGVDAQARRLAPGVLAVSRELRDAPDAVLVDVTGAGENVRIETRDDRLMIGVRSASERVRVVVPLATVEKVLRRVEKAGASASPAASADHARRPHRRPAGGAAAA